MLRSRALSLAVAFTGVSQATPETFSRVIEVNGEPVPLQITIDFDHLDDKGRAVAKTLPDAYFAQWPQIARMIDAPLLSTPKHLNLSFLKDMGYPAHVAGQQMVISAGHASADPEEVQGVFTHELTHFVQFYPQGGGTPVWFMEGVADLVRYCLHPESAWAASNIKHTDKTKALGAYWQSSAFLLWMEQTYGKPVVAMVSRSCADGKYDASIFKRETGMSVDELVAAYQASDWVAPGE